MFILGILFVNIILLYLISNIVFAVRTKKLQKEWNKEKAIKLRLIPRISNAELCEYYVMFCKRNDCKVDF